MEASAKRTLAMILGLIGGVLLLVVGAVVIIYDIATGATLLTIIGMVMLLTGAAATVGGALARRAPVASGVLMLVSGGLAIFMLSIVSAALLITGGIFAILGRQKEEAMPMPVATGTEFPSTVTRMGPRPVEGPEAEKKKEEKKAA